MNLLCSFNGRIGRRQWWLGVSGVAVFVVLLTVVVIAMATQAAPALASSDLFLQATGPVMVFVHWLLTLPVNVKRGHDRGRSGWWQLLGLVPVAYLWLLFDQALLRSVQANEWGPPAVPLQSAL